jgi:hypothetical protein
MGLPSGLPDCRRFESVRRSFRRQRRRQPDLSKLRGRKKTSSPIASISCWTLNHASVSPERYCLVRCEGTPEPQSWRRCQVIVPCIPWTTLTRCIRSSQRSQRRDIKPAFRSVAAQGQHSVSVATDSSNDRGLNRAYTLIMKTVSRCSRRFDKTGCDLG